MTAAGATRSWMLALLVGWASCQCREQAPVDEIGPKLAAALAAKGPTYHPRTRHLRPDGRPRYTNRLILETSPYLLEHAHNPVDWYPWGDEAFAKAAREDKPILLSIGYASCHWCHVMADESWEDEAIARQINQGFVAIKVDREERPDVDAIYLAAVERLTGDGGWPLTVILLPDRRPIFGGTYFPPHDGPRGPGLATVLARVRRAYETRRGELAAVADRLVAALRRTGPEPGQRPGAAAIRAAVAAFAAGFDPAWGGFGGAPKFPRPAVLELLLRYHRRTGDAQALAMVTRTLDRMAAGGIHDHVGGGFHRYAVDARWHVPHFEKMLYDNAQLAAVYLAAYQVTGRADYAAVARDTLDFVIRDLQAPDGGFYGALDADTVGGEGRTYTWTAAEIDRAVGGRAGPIVREVFDVTAGGNFEGGRSVLWRPATLDEVAARLGQPPADVAAVVAAAIPKLRAARATRPRPRVDDKRIVAWNGLAISALARGALVLDDRGYLDAARSAAAFVLSRARTADGRLAHQVAGGRASGPAFLDDVAFLEAGLIDLLEVDPTPRWLQEAWALQRTLDTRFADPRGGYFFTAADQDAVLVRDKPASDDALPAGNSVAALAALRLAELTGEDAPRARAEATLRAFAGTLTRSPTALPAMLAALDFSLDRAKQIVVVTPDGDDDAALLAPLRAAYVPNRVVLRVPDRGPAYTPLLAGKTAQHGKPTAYVCLGTHCERPTSDPSVLAAQLARTEPL